MTRLLVHVEGETEEEFVKTLLAPHLYDHGYTSVGARLVGNARRRHRRGGIKAWDTVANDISRHLKEDGSCLATTMVDYYALPKAGAKAWPGREQAATAPYPNNVEMVEAAIHADVCRRMGDDFNSSRFVPFILMHEFEALLFSDCHRFSLAIGLPHLGATFQAIRNQFVCPETINDSPTTAPSKRVEDLVPSYQKPLYGNVAALAIGLDAIRSQCPHFAQWIKRLENAPASF